MAVPISRQEKIYAEFSKKVKCYVSSHVENTHDREDVISEIFLKIYASLDRFDETKASMSTWIYTITKNTVIDYYRSKRTFETLSENAAADDDGELDFDLDALAEALSKLGKRERDLIILHYYSGYTLKSIAEMINISYIYAKVIHKKALTELEGLMKG